MNKQSFYSVTPESFESWWIKKGGRPGPHKRVQASLIQGSSQFKKKHSEIASQITDALGKEFSYELPKILEHQKASDNTEKFLFELEDGHKVETVALPFNKKYTLCLSTQVGCAMACQFCFTGTQGLSRQLEAHEIVGQYLAVWGHLKATINHLMTPNIVFMGQGEPLHNFENLKRALEQFVSLPGLSLGPRQMTLSTVGYLPGLERWEELPPINLAISLHSPFNEERSRLIPMNRAYSLEKIVSVLERFSWGRRKLINFEYLLLGELNDTEPHARALARLISPFPSLVNLIPFNPYPGSPFQKPSLERVEQFKDWLVKEKVRTMVRVTKGDDILAACGQLANTFS